MEEGIILLLFQMFKEFLYNFFILAIAFILWESGEFLFNVKLTLKPRTVRF